MGMAIRRDRPAHAADPICRLGSCSAPNRRCPKARSDWIAVERDANSFRGTGGALRDAAEAGNDDDLLLIANAAQIMLDPLPLLLPALHRLGGDVALIAHADGAPSGAMLLPRAALKLIPTFGFVDLKEQALPIIAKQFDVRVLRRARPTGLPVRKDRPRVLHRPSPISPPPRRPALR